MSVLMKELRFLSWKLVLINIDFCSIWSGELDKSFKKKYDPIQAKGIFKVLDVSKNQ